MNELGFSFFEVVGYSTTTLAEAIHNALLVIEQSLYPPLWVEKVVTQAVMDKDQLAGWHVMLRIGFAEEPAGLVDVDPRVTAEEPTGALILGPNELTAPLNSDR